MEKLMCSVSPRIYRDGGRGFGAGVMRLLGLTDEKGSLRAAAGEMNMSYSKAWSSVKHCEETLGFSLLDRRTGGEGGGGARLTPEGRAFLDAYRALESDCARATEALAAERLAPWL